MNKKLLFATLFIAALFTSNVHAQTVATFEDLGLPVDSLWNGSDKSGGFTNGNASFSNTYNSTYSSWVGFAYSSKKDSVTAGFGNMYSSANGMGYNNSSTYAVGFVSAYSGATSIKLKGDANGKVVDGFYINNNTYAYQSMLNGDTYAKKFTSHDSDWFMLRTFGYLNGTVTDSVDFYLADFRFADSSKAYIIKSWTWVDLSTLGNVDSLSFSMSSSDNGQYGMNTPAYFCMDDFTTTDGAIYAPAVGQPGSTAISKDSSTIVAWANQATITRGWQNIADQSKGKTTIGDEKSAVGEADNKVVSLGDGGSAILQFAKPIENGVGPDFAVFENGFKAMTGGVFLELAFVEVSSDGQRYVRFPAHSNTQTTKQVGGFEGLHADKINNLAGKYKGGYGTPFDLEELKDSTGLDIMHITHVKIIDVVGSIDDAYASYDADNNKINDPYPTPFPSSGFDLDAIGVINVGEDLATDVHDPNNQISIYPNPTQNILTFQYNESGFVEVLSINGQILLSQRFTKGETTLDLSSLDKGVYFLRIKLSDGVLIRRVLKN